MNDPLSAVIIVAHPEKDSLGEANAKAIAKGAKKNGYSVETFHIFDFPLVNKNPIKAKGFPAEFDKPTDAMAAADQIIVVGPMWNFGYPGMYKNFLDGVIQAHKFFRFVPVPILVKLVELLPGLKHIVPTAFPEGMLKAKKVTMIWTADGPTWYYRVLAWKNNIALQTRAAFAYSGVKKFKQIILGTTRLRTKEEIKAWLEKLENHTF